MPVKVVSEPNGNHKDMYKIRWSVESYAKPIEYKILYRQMQVGSLSYLRLARTCPYLKLTWKFKYHPVLYAIIHR